MTLVSIVALANMLIGDDYKYIGFPLAILCFAIGDLLKYTSDEDITTGTYSGYDKTYWGTDYSANSYTAQTKTHHTTYSSTTRLNDSKDMEEKAMNAIKRGPIITIEKTNK